MFDERNGILAKQNAELRAINQELVEALGNVLHILRSPNDPWLPKYSTDITNAYAALEKARAE
jgi:hypothetical protein